MKSINVTRLALGASPMLFAVVSAKDITISVAGPLTGIESAFGRPTEKTAEKAIEQINAPGGVQKSPRPPPLFKPAEGVPVGAL